MIYLLVLVFVLSPIFTSFNNSYELRIGDRSIPGFYPLDAAKMALHNLIALAPFFVAMRFLSSDHARSLLLKSLVIAALIYSLPMLFEVRFSPQLHRMVYGFTPASFGQQVRGGGYRPVVFLGGGLEVALFVSLAFVAAVIAARAKWRILHVPAGAAATYLGVMLVLCKTLGAMIYALIAAPLVLFTAPRTWVKVAIVIISIVCAYPFLRDYDLVPVHRVVAAAKAISADRSASFETRVVNEDKLLAKANQKPFFGWGTWGRNRVYEQDTGGDLTITDGEWIIQFGGFGWFGYLSLFGLFAAAVMRARVAIRQSSEDNAMVLGGLCLLLAANLIDLIPNANLVPSTYLMAGSIAGCIRARSRRRRSQQRTVDSFPPAVAVP
jgi:hypothetical protein